MHIARLAPDSWQHAFPISNSHEMPQVASLMDLRAVRGKK